MLYKNLPKAKKESLSRQPLTARQREALNFIMRSIRTRGYGPSLREVALALGITAPNGAMAHVVALEKKGYIRREANASRAIQVLDRSQKLPPGLSIPACIQGGRLYKIRTDTRLHLSQYLPSEDEKFFLIHVEDDSLLPHQIRPGDFLLFRRARAARFDEKVLFRKEMPHTLGVCKLNPITQKTYLRPLDPTSDDQLPNDALTIYGVLVATLRLETQIVLETE